MTLSTLEPQTSFDEQALEKPAITAALESVQSAREAVAVAKENLAEQEKILDGLLGELDLEEGSHRAGRFVLKVSNVAAHQRFRFKPAKDA